MGRKTAPATPESAVRLAFTELKLTVATSEDHLEKVLSKVLKSPPTYAQLLAVQEACAQTGQPAFTAGIVAEAIKSSLPDAFSTSLNDVAMSEARRTTPRCSLPSSRSTCGSGASQQTRARACRCIARCGPSTFPASPGSRATASSTSAAST